MPQRFKLIARKNLGKDVVTAPKKFYPQAVNDGHVNFAELCTEIVENCTLTSTEVKAVMDRMNYILDKILKQHQTVVRRST